MEVRWSIFIIILGSALVTFIPRVLPIAILSRVELPEWAMRWLSYVPIAVMAALVGQELLMPNGKLEPLHKNLELIAALAYFYYCDFNTQFIRNCCGWNHFYNGITFCVLNWLVMNLVISIQAKRSRPLID